MSDDLYGCDAHLEAAYEDANGSPLPEHQQDWDESIDDGDEQEARLNALKGWS